MSKNIKVKKIYPYGLHENHICYWASEDESLTFTDKLGSQGYWQCDQTEDAYQFDEKNKTMIWDTEVNL